MAKHSINKSFNNEQVQILVSNKKIHIVDWKARKITAIDREVHKSSLPVNIKKR